MELCNVIFHSHEWDVLVETGWITRDVYQTREGFKVATMVRPRKR